VVIDLDEKLSGTMLSMAVKEVIAVSCLLKPETVGRLPG
jgi:hypothetical protein